jgi:hypothetical protein
MYNWNTVESTIAQDPKRHEQWRLEQAINYGLNGDRIDASTLRTHWDSLTLDPDRKRFMALILADHAVRHP